MPAQGNAGPIRVARIIARLNVGGPAIQAITLARELQNGSFSSTLITGVVGSGEADMTPEARAQGVQPIVLPELGREISWKNDAVALWKLVKLLRTLKPDVVHTHTAKAGFLGRLAALVAGVPVRVHTFHGHVLHGYFGRLKSRVFLALERLLGRVTDRLVVLSEGQRGELAELYRVAPEAKCRVVPLGFDLSPFEKPPGPGRIRSRVGLPPGVLLIGFIGRLVPIKNPWLLLEALALMKAHRIGPDGVHAVIVGGGELEDALKRAAAERGLDHHVTWLGWQREMPAIYADLDLVVLTSNNEGTPVALIEAMASGRPFVATAVGGVRDLMRGPGQSRRGPLDREITVYDNGLLVPPHDPGALAAACLWCLENREAARRMGGAGREFALQRFDKARLVRDIQALYTELLVTKGIRVAAPSSGSSSPFVPPL